MSERAKGKENSSRRERARRTPTSSQQKGKRKGKAKKEVYGERRDGASPMRIVGSDTVGRNRGNSDGE